MTSVSIVPDTTEDISGGEACHFNEAPNTLSVPAYGFSVTKGRRAGNEDRISVTPCMQGNPGHNLYGVYDGHCGHRAAEFSKVDIPMRISKTMANYPETIPPDAALAMLTKTFKEADAAFCAQASAQGMEDGTTAVVVLLSGYELYCAGCGDSRALLCRMGAPIPLSKEHKPGDKAEKARIERAGGEVKHNGGVARVNGILATSRAIGDNHLKPMVIPDPYVSHRKLTRGDDFVVLGSDGLFDYVGPNTVCQTVMNSADAKSAAQTLVKLAIHHGSWDNVSVVVVDLRTFFQDRYHATMGQLQSTKVTPLNMPQRIKSMADKLVSGVDLFALPEEHSGWLCKQSRSSMLGQRWQKRWFVLHSVTGQAGADFSVHKEGIVKSVVFVLHYHDSEEQSHAENPRKPIFIDPAMGVTRETHLDRPDLAVISFFEATSGAAFLVSAATVREADLWVGKCEESFAKHGFGVPKDIRTKKNLVRSLSEMEGEDANQVLTTDGQPAAAPEGIVHNGQFTGPVQLERSDTGGLHAIGGGWSVTSAQMANMDINTLGFPRAGFMMTPEQVQAFGLPPGSAVVR